MSALRQSLPSSLSALAFERMEAQHIGEVLTIENDVFPFPWKHGSFLGCVASEYECWLARDMNENLAGYFIVMKVIDEAHLLTIGLRRDLHGRGYGPVMLRKVVEIAHALDTDSVFLEVRVSNENAFRLYRRFGFLEIGRRRNYYEAAAGTREDAIMMSLPI